MHRFALAMKRIGEKVRRRDALNIYDADSLVNEGNQWQNKARGN